MMNQIFGGGNALPHPPAPAPPQARNSPKLKKVKEKKVNIEKFACRTGEGWGLCPTEPVCGNFYIFLARNLSQRLIF